MLRYYVFLVLLLSIAACDIENSLQGELGVAPEVTQPSNENSDNLVTVPEETRTDLGPVGIGTTITEIIVITNSGNEILKNFEGENLGGGPFAYTGGDFPGAGGSCEKSLAPGESCSVNISYTPTEQKEDVAAVTVAYVVGETPGRSENEIRGSGTPFAYLEISSEESSINEEDFGTQGLATNADKKLKVKNRGAQPATEISPDSLGGDFDFSGGTYPGTNGTCSSALDVHGECTIEVTFVPASAGVQQQDLAINYNDGAQSKQSKKKVKGAGTTKAFLTFEDTNEIDFGQKAVSGSEEKFLNIKNTGALAATSITGGLLNSSVFSFKGGAYPGTGGTCGASLAAGASCTIVVLFKPTEEAYSVDDIELDYNDGVAPAKAKKKVKGKGTKFASIQIVEGGNYSFGEVQAASTSNYTFTIYNSGSKSATNVSATTYTLNFQFQGGIYPGSTGTCTDTLAAGATCILSIDFNPLAVSSYNDTLKVSYSDGKKMTSSQVLLDGRGVGTANLVISELDPFNYGLRANNGSFDQNLIVTNTGSVNATSISGSVLTTPFSYKGGTFPGTGGTCGSGLAPGVGCTIVVNFNPTSLGLHTDSFQVNYNDGVSAQSVTKNLQGTAAAPAVLAISDGPTYDFGSHPLGSTVNYTFTVDNTGGVTALNISDALALAPPFSFSGGSFPGTNGDCTSTLANASNCTIEVSYSPSTAVLSSDTIVISYNDGAAAQSVSRSVQGTGLSAASLSLSDGPIYNFGNLAANSSTDYTFTLDNVGGVGATSVVGSGLAAPFSFKGGSYPGTGGTCSGSLASVSNCTVVVNFNPTTTGTFNDTIVIDYHDGATMQSTSRDVQGTASSPASISISETSPFDYGIKTVGTNTDHTFTIINSGGVPATSLNGSGLVAPYSFKGGAYPGTGGDCGGSLAASASCAVVVTFSPAATGIFNDTLSMDYNDGLGSQSATRDLTAQGTNAAFLTISDGPTLDYGSQGTGSSSDYTFTVTNTGGSAASSLTGSGLVAPFSFKGGTYPGTGGSCSTSLGISANCTMVVNYSPATTGVHSDTIDLNYNDGATGQIASRNVQGTGVNLATLTLSDGPSYSFGNVVLGASQDYAFTVNNVGSGTANSLADGLGLAAPYGFKGGTYPGTGGNCGVSLANGANCIIVVTFAPVATGAFNDTIQLDYSDGVASQSVTRDVTGIGVNAALLTISDGPTLSFGTLAVGASSDHVFTISNSGGTAATSLSGSGLLAPYGFKGGAYPGVGGTCATSLANGANCTVVVTYAPSATGVHTDTLQIDYNDGLSAQSATRDVSGTGANVALLSISDGPVFDYGSQSTGTNTDHTFTISNSGGVSATSMSGTGLVAPFTFKGGSYPGVGGTCTSTLAAAANCTVVITYSPTVTGAHADTLQMLYNDGTGATSATRDIQGTGI